jgi:uncharacterized protein (TIGR03086 family)
MLSFVYAPAQPPLLTGAAMMVRMTDAGPRALLPAAAREFGDRVHAVPADGWDRDTPDEGWTVRDLVGHLVNEHLWVPPLLAGQTMAEIGDRFDGDVLGDDPVRAWDEAIAASLRSWERADDDRLVDLSSGPAPAREYAEQMVLDLVVHSWDLARGAGLDERLPAGLVSHVRAYVEPHAEPWRRAGIFGPRVRVDSDDPQDLLLGLLGRRP